MMFRVFGRVDRADVDDCVSSLEAYRSPRDDNQSKHNQYHSNGSVQRRTPLDKRGSTASAKLLYTYTGGFGNARYLSVICCKPECRPCG
jgi:hypothetical protein